MIETYKKIIEICENSKESEWTLRGIKSDAENALLRWEWLTLYGIKISETANIKTQGYYNFNEYEGFSFFDDKGTKYISISYDGRQPKNEYVYTIWLSTGPFIFGNDYVYQTTLFEEFFGELRGYNPDYLDLENKALYWKIENAGKIFNDFSGILNKYHAINKSQLKEREIAKLEAKLNKLKGEK